MNRPRTPKEQRRDRRMNRRLVMFGVALVAAWGFVACVLWFAASV
jgi:hypothetical protein